MIRAEVASNAYLHKRHALNPSQHQHLLEMGWLEPTFEPEEEPDNGSPNYFVDVAVGEASRVAAMAVGALRDVFGAPHPSFLTTSGLPGDMTQSAPPPTGPRLEDDEETLAVIPTGPGHLRGLVDAALVPMFGQLPVHDEDDDIPIRTGSAMVFVRVLPDAPVVELFSRCL